MHLVKLWSVFLFVDYLVNKLEDKIGLDLNKDGRIGGPGITAKIEQATHVDLNRDGIIGGHRPSPGGGNNKAQD